MFVNKGDSYKHLGTDENIIYHGPLDTEKFMEENITWMKKTWSSELPDYKKTTAHNYAFPIITPIRVLE